MKLADRCRKEARDFYLYDNKDCVEWKAAEMLDECEDYIKAQQCGCENKISDFTCSRCAMLDKLRAQERG